MERIVGALIAIGLGLVVASVDPSEIRSAVCHQSWSLSVGAATSWSLLTQGVLRCPPTQRG